MPFLYFKNIYVLGGYLFTPMVVLWSQYINYMIQGRYGGVSYSVPLKLQIPLVSMLYIYYAGKPTTLKCS